MTRSGTSKLAPTHRGGKGGGMQHSDRPSSRRRMKPPMWAVGTHVPEGLRSSWHHACTSSIPSFSSPCFSSSACGISLTRSHIHGRADGGTPIARSVDLLSGFLLLRPSFFPAQIAPRNCLPPPPPPPLNVLLLLLSSLPPLGERAAAAASLSLSSLPPVLTLALSSSRDDRAGKRDGGGGGGEVRRPLPPLSPARPSSPHSFPSFLLPSHNNTHSH